MNNKNPSPNCRGFPGSRPREIASRHLGRVGGWGWDLKFSGVPGTSWKSRTIQHQSLTNQKPVGSRKTKQSTNWTIDLHHPSRTPQKPHKIPRDTPKTSRNPRSQPLKPNPTQVPSERPLNDGHELTEGKSYDRSADIGLLFAARLRRDSITHCTDWQNNMQQQVCDVRSARSFDLRLPGIVLKPRLSCTQENELHEDARYDPFPPWHQRTRSTLRKLCAKFCEICRI